MANHETLRIGHEWEQTNMRTRRSLGKTETQKHRKVKKRETQKTIKRETGKWRNCGNSGTRHTTERTHMRKEEYEKTEKLRKDENAET